MSIASAAKLVIIDRSDFGEVTQPLQVDCQWLKPPCDITAGTVFFNVLTAVLSHSCGVWVAVEDWPEYSVAWLVSTQTAP